MIRTRDERGATFPSPLVLFSVVAIAMAIVAFVATRDAGGPNELQTVSERPSASPSPSAPATTQSPAPAPSKKARPKPEPVDRGATYVEVYNNSGISGLAGETAAEAQGKGWQVVSSDNWYGTIPASTVYYPERLRRAGKLLADDLGVARLKPAVDPMRGDRLTVILTSDHAG